jgi:hypothetical protein
MSGNWFNGFVPVARNDATIAEAILASTAAMRRSGTFATASLCWSAVELESLAMFTIDLKNRAAATPEGP